MSLPPPVPVNELDFKDPEAFAIGIKYAESWRVEHPWSPPGGHDVYLGFNLRRWFERVLQRWERGRLTSEQKRQVAHLFNWLTVSPERFPKARCEMAKLDPIKLERRIEQYLWKWDSYRPGWEHEDMIRDSLIGYGSIVRPRDIVAVIPENLPPDRRGDLALELLERVGAVMQDAGDVIEMAASGFVEALREPGRDHGFEDRAPTDRKPRGKFENYDLGWQAGQEAVHLLDPSKPRRQDRRQRQRGRETPRSRRGRDGRP